LLPSDDDGPDLARVALTIQAGRWPGIQTGRWPGKVGATQFALPQLPSDTEDLPTDHVGDGIGEGAGSESRVTKGQEDPCCLQLGDCCSKKCTRPLMRDCGEELEKLRDKLETLTKPDADRLLWHMIQFCGPETSDDGMWKLGSKAVCKKGWQMAVGLGTSRLTKLVSAMKLGCLQPWEDQRKFNGKQESPQYWDADAFLCFLYQYVGESLADSGVEVDQTTNTNTAILDWVIGREGHNPLASSTVGLLTGGDPHYIAHMSKAELYELYKFHGAPDPKQGKASQATFLRVFTTRWKYLIRIREEAQHARCDDCAKLTKIRKEDPDARNREAANVAYRKHLQRMLADRALDHRLSLLSEYSTERGSTQHSRILHLRIDGMDQAKFKCPRNLCDAKQWASLWRPTLHMVGCMVEGLLEIFFLTDQDVKKDSNMEMTCISLTLDLAQQELQKRGLTMPEHLSLNWDNTAREGKNQHLAKYQAWLVSTGRFRSVQDGQGQVGHTHNKQDQRFSVVATILKGAAVLQTPEDFIDTISKNVNPPGNRQLVVSKLNASYDWRPFFEPLAMSVTGIAASVPNPDVCHSKRFILRADLDKLLPKGTEVEVPEIFGKEPPDPADVFMLAKEFWSSDRLSQAPLLFLPKVVANRLAPGGPVATMDRNRLSDEQLRQFRRTAAKAGEAPWNLARAEHYLNQWCLENERAAWPQPVRLQFVVDGGGAERWQGWESEALEHDEWLRYASGAPAPIKVAAVKRRAGEPAAGAAKRPRPAVLVSPPAADQDSEASNRASGLGGQAEQDRTAPNRASGLGGSVVDQGASGQGGSVADQVASRRASGLGGNPVPGGPGGAGGHGPAEQEPALLLGCSKCRYQARGCQQCRRPNFRGRRGPQA